MRTRSKAKLPIPSSSSTLSTPIEVSLHRLVRNTQQHFDLGTVFLLQPGGAMGDGIRPDFNSWSFETNDDG